MSKATKKAFKVTNGADFIVSGDKHLLALK
jgi:hypothetical protein